MIFPEMEDTHSIDEMKLNKTMKWKRNNLNEMKWKGNWIWPAECMHYAQP